MARRCPVFPAAHLPLNVPVAIGVALILAGLYKTERSRTTVYVGCAFTGREE
jgi:hypothetical protein